MPRGLALIDAPARRTLFPQSELAEQLSEDGTTLHVSTLEGFPKEAGFRVQIKGEFLKVIDVDGKDWKVERAVERTASGYVPAGHDGRPGSDGSKAIRSHAGRVPRDDCFQYLRETGASI